LIEWIALVEMIFMLHYAILAN